MKQSIKVADECWIALAKLTREESARSSFTAREILDRVRREAAHPELRPGVQTHIHSHNVANLPPSPGRYRMFYRLADGTYKLYRPGDSIHPERLGKSHPKRTDLPVEYHQLLDWYEAQYCDGLSSKPSSDDPIRGMRGLGKELWAGIDADDYVRELRSGWEAATARSSPTDPTNREMLWRRVSKYQGAEFRTKEGLPFSYKLEGSGFWVYRDGERIDQRLSRKQLEQALEKLPLNGPSDLQTLRGSSYLYGLLTDPRIIGSESRAA